MCSGGTTPWSGWTPLQIEKIKDIMKDSTSLTSLFLPILIFQPLFPGESAVDQLVEIIKVVHLTQLMKILDFFISVEKVCIDCLLNIFRFLAHRQERRYGA